MARHCSAAEALSEALLELDRALYAQTAATWKGRELWQQLAAYRDEKHGDVKEEGVGLEALYRSY